MTDYDNNKLLFRRPERGQTGRHTAWVHRNYCVIMFYRYYLHINQCVMRIYISGQITGLSRRQYRRNFNLARLEMIERFGVTIDIVNPLEITPLFWIRRWFFFMVADIWQQRKCTHTAFQSNWLNSRGAVIEYFFAKFVFKQQIIFL